MVSYVKNECNFLKLRISIGFGVPAGIFLGLLVSCMCLVRSGNLF